MGNYRYSGRQTGGDTGLLFAHRPGDYVLRPTPWRLAVTDAIAKCANLQAALSNGGAEARGKSCLY